MAPAPAPMAAMMSRTMSARFIPLRCRCQPAVATLPSAPDDRDPQASERRLLQALELDERSAVAEDVAELGVLGVREVSLRQDDLKVRRDADVELALFGFELLRRELARGLRRLNGLGVVLHADGGVG